MSGRLRATLALVLLAAAPAAAARPREQPAPRIEVLEARRDGERFVVSYRLLDLLPPEVMERIHSGIRLRFRHRIEIVEPRPGLFAGDRTHGRATLETSVSYDSLTQRYELAREIALRDRARGPAAEPLEERTLVDSEQEMRSWLTEVRELAISDPHEAETVDPTLRVRIEVVLGRRWILLVIPSSETISVEQELGAGG